MEKLIIGVKDPCDKWQNFKTETFSLFCLEPIGYKEFFQNISVQGVGRLIFLQQFIAGAVVTSDKLNAGVVVTGNKLLPVSLLPAILAIK